MIVISSVVAKVVRKLRRKKTYYVNPVLLKETSSFTWGVVPPSACKSLV